MAIDIPLPKSPMQAFLESLNTASAVGHRFMEPRLRREEIAARKQATDLANAFRLQQLQQQAQQHMENLGLRQRQEERLGAMIPYEQALNARRLEKLNMELDPDKKADYTKRFMEGIGIKDYSAITPGQRAQLAIGGVKLPEVKETPEQKQQRMIATATAVDTAKTDKKEADKILASAQGLIPHIGTLYRLQQIAKKKPKLFGVSTKIADTLGLTKDPDVGAYISGSQRLQSELAQEASKHSGYGIYNLVGAAKPNISKAHAFNIGALSDIEKTMRTSFDLMKKSYESKSGQKFPYSFDQYYKELEDQQDKPQDKKSSPEEKILRVNPVTGKLE